MTYAVHEDGGPVPHIYHRKPSHRTPGRWYVSVTGHRYPAGETSPWDLGFTQWAKAAQWAARCQQARKEHATA